MAGRKKLTREDIQEQIRQLEEKDKALEAMEKLPQHAGVKKLNQGVTQAVKDTGADEVFVRIAELKMSKMDLAEFYRELKGTVDEWMFENATYRNPGDEKEFWYSPEGKGNPPKWMKDLVGKKPDAKDKDGLEAWLKKAEKYKVKTVATKKAA